MVALTLWKGGSLYHSCRSVVLSMGRDGAANQVVQPMLEEGELLDSMAGFFKILAVLIDIRLQLNVFYLEIMRPGE